MTIIEIGHSYGGASVVLWT